MCIRDRHEGVFPNREPDCAPAAFLTQPEWIPLLEKAAETTSDHWHTWFQLGVMYYANGRESQAERAFEKSMERTENAWAIRCLALLQLMGGDAGEAMIKMRRAVELKPIDALVIEFGRMLLDEEAYTEYLALYDTLAPDAVSYTHLDVYKRQHGKLQNHICRRQRTGGANRIRLKHFK